MSSAVWKLQIKSLAQDFRLIVPDLRGHGQSGDGGGEMTLFSCVDDLDDLLCHLEIPSCVLVGWSLGAQVAIQACERVCRRLSGMVLVSATPCFVSRPDFSPALPAKDVEGMRLKVSRNLERALDGFRTLTFSSAEKSAEEFGSRTVSILDSIPLPDPGTALAGLRILACTDLRQQLPLLDLPVLVIGGSDDRISPREASMAISEMVPGSSLIVFDDCGHAPFLTQPVRFDQVLTQFVRGLVSDEC